jgi:hypothetical protein
VTIVTKIQGEEPLLLNSAQTAAALGKDYSDVVYSLGMAVLHTPPDPDAVIPGEIE